MKRVVLLFCCLFANLAAAKDLSKRDLDAIRAAQRVDIARPPSTHVALETSQGKLALASTNTTTYVYSSELENDFFVRFELPDPVSIFEARFAEFLKGSTNGQPLMQTRVLAGKREIADAIKTTTADYVVEIDRPSLTISEHVFRRPRFEIMLMGWAKIRRVHDKATVWSGLCTFFERDDKQLLFDEEPLVDNAAVLRKLIPLAANGCAEKMMAKLETSPPVPK